MQHGARAVIPAKINSSGKSMGNMARRRRAADSLVPREMRRRLMRGGDTQSLPPEARREAQRGRMGENACGRRSAVGHVIGAPRAAFTGAVSSRRPGPVAAAVPGAAVVANATDPPLPQDRAGDVARQATEPADPAGLDTPRP